MLIDTSGFYCLLQRTDPFHVQACRFYEAAAARVTTNYVVAELIALAAVRGLPREPVLAFAAELATSPEIDMVWIDRAIHEEALALLRTRVDKTYSLCDAVSFIVLRRNGLRQALTTDRHFAQEGFERLLVSSP